MLGRVIRGAALTVGVVFLAGSAMAACPVTPSLTDSDTVIKFGSAASGQPKGAMGSKKELGSDHRQAGAMYYDHSARALKLCDGSAWVGVGETGSGSSGGTFPVDSMWSHSASGTGNIAWTVPYESEGAYRMGFYLSSAYTCYLEARKSDGTWDKVAYISGGGSEDGSFTNSSGLTFRPMGGNNVRVALDYWVPTQQYSGAKSYRLTGGNTYWRGPANTTWDRRMRISSTNGCTLQIQVWRTD
jgi:hypothetical protein